MPLNRLSPSGFLLAVVMLGGLPACAPNTGPPVEPRLAPEVSAVAPRFVPTGTTEISLTVVGDEFTSDAVVRWNGADRPTTWTSTAELTVVLSAADIASPGVGEITVFIPEPGGGESEGFEVVLFDAIPFNVASVPFPAGQAWDVSISVTGVAYVTRVGSSTVSEFDVPSNGLIGSVTAGNWPYEISFSPAGDVAYAANLDALSISVINTTTGATTAVYPVAGRPIRVKVSPDGSRLYVTTVAGDVLSLDAATGTPTHSALPVGGVLNGLVVTPDGSRLWVTSTTGVVAEINTAAWTTARAFEMDGRPQDAITTADGSALYVANEFGWIGRYNLTTMALTDSIPAPSPFALALNPDGTQLWASNPVQATLRVYRTTDHSLAGVLMDGERPRNIGFHPDGTALIANELGGVYLIREVP